MSNFRFSYTALALLLVMCGPACALPATQRRKGSFLQMGAVEEGEHSTLTHMEALHSVVHGSYSKDVVSAWGEYQVKMLRAMHDKPLTNRSFKVLVVSSVTDTDTAVDNFEANLKKLKKNRANDTFEFALNHHDSSNELWKKHSWYTNETGPIVVKKKKHGCKVEFWGQIEPKLAQKYDYVWLLDEDMRLDFFSWDLYRHFLATLDPLVTQPSIVSREKGGRSTNKVWLRMEGPNDGTFGVAHEIDRTEVQAPILSSRIWEPINMRLKAGDLKSEKYVADFWDMAAVLSKIQCQKPNALLINGSPLRHMNYKTQTTQKSDCLGVSSKANNRPLSKPEGLNLLESLKTYCGFTEQSKTHCLKKETLRQCRMRLNEIETYPRFKSLRTWWGVHLKDSPKN